MEILVVNSYGKGGAASACKRLHLGLLNAGVSSKILLNYQNNWDASFQFMPETREFSFQEKLTRKLRRLAQELKLYKTKSVLDFRKDFLNNRAENLELFSFPHSNLDITQSQHYKEADIINLHWVANFLDFESFFKKNDKPVVWTLHDMNPFSGGEHYLEEYLGIDEYGVPIKREWTKKELQVAKDNIEIKKLVMAKVDNLILVAPSKWLAEKARKSEVFKGKTVKCIPNGLDPKTFKMRDQNFSKELFNIPKQKKVILFVADTISNNRKGFIFLQRALEQLADDNLILCAIGDKGSKLEFGNNNIIELGTINDERLMSIAYSAADVFVIPSLMDNLPNTVLESLMCGTPVIGFPIGGIPDMIQDGENGLLTEEISVSSLAKTLSKFLDTHANFDRIEIRENALKKYDQKIQAESYIKLFEEVLHK